MGFYPLASPQADLSTAGASFEEANMGRTSSTTQTIKVIREIPGEYVRAGETYKVTRAESGRGLKARAHFFNTARQSGTSVPEWQVVKSIMTGALLVVA